jgi:hypothetical protein
MRRPSDDSDRRPAVILATLTDDGTDPERGASTYNARQIHKYLWGYFPGLFTIVEPFGSGGTSNVHSLPHRQQLPMTTFVAQMSGYHTLKSFKCPE